MEKFSGVGLVGVQRLLELVSVDCKFKIVRGHNTGYEDVVDLINKSDSSPSSGACILI